MTDKHLNLILFLLAKELQAIAVDIRDIDSALYDKKEVTDTWRKVRNVNLNVDSLRHNIIKSYSEETTEDDKNDH